ncbi:MAG: polysaccharide deacetylase family protein [Burkholderiales bacterium]|nr:polysaccharide deacetylase family protein [Burkholderiales bacterium]
MLNLPLTLLSPAGARARLSILIFHRVLPQPDPLFPDEIDAQGFDHLLGIVGSMFNVLPLDEAVARLDRGGLPARSLAITFDDGYADNCTQAMPILQRHGMTATFFIATGFLDGGRMWNDTVIEAFRRTPHARLDLSPLGLQGLAEFTLLTPAQRRAAVDAVLGVVKYLSPPERASKVQQLADLAGAPLADDLMMSSAQVRALRAGGMQIGAHTVSHPILARLDRDEARREIAQSKATLEALLGERVGLFAYPNGKPGQDYGPEAVQITRELGFDAAVSTAWGATRRDSDRFQLPRFTPWDRTPARFGARMAGNLLRS